MVKDLNKKDKKYKKHKKDINNKLVDKKTKLAAFNKSFNINYISHISIVISIFILYKSVKNNTSYLNILLSFYLISLHGYFAHYLGHKINFTKWFNNSNNILKEFTITNKIFNFITKILNWKKIKKNFDHIELTKVILEDSKYMESLEVELKNSKNPESLSRIDNINEFSIKKKRSLISLGFSSLKNCEASLMIFSEYSFLASGRFKI